MAESAGIPKLLDLIYSSALDPTVWAHTLTTLADAFASETTGFAYGHRGGGGGISLFVRSDAEWERQYAEYYSFRNPMIRGEALFREGLTMPSHQICPDADMVRTEYYADFLRPRDLRFALGTFLAMRASTASTIVMFRSGRRGPFEGAEVRALDRLVPHFQLAIRIHRRMSALRDSASITNVIKGHPGYAVFSVDSRARIAWTNEAADLMLSANDGIVASHNHLSCQGANETTRLRQLIRSACARSPSTVAGGQMAVCRAERPPLIALVAPGRNGHALVMVASETSTTPEDERLVATALHLTPQQARIAVMLAGGMDIRQIAEAVGITRETTRTHLKNIFKTTGMRSQAQLVRSVLQIRQLSLRHP